MERSITRSYLLKAWVAGGAGGDSLQGSGKVTGKVGLCWGLRNNLIALCPGRNEAAFRQMSFVDMTQYV